MVLTKTMKMMGEFGGEKWYRSTEVLKCTKVFAPSPLTSTSHHSLQMERAMGGLNEMCYNLNDDFTSSGPHPQHSEQEELLEKGRQEMEILLTEAINMASLDPLPSAAVSQRKRCLHASQNVLNLSLNLTLPTTATATATFTATSSATDENPPALAQPLLTVTSIAAILHLTLPMMSTTKR